MNTIKVLISASEEMHDEKVQFASLIENLNEALALKGIELERVKWDPESDGSVEDFMEEVTECEMCLTLHWQQLAKNAEKELDAAYKELKDGHNPQNLYIFFKEPCPEINQALTQFKEGIVSKYGHFFCKFENVDTMNLQFVMQLLKAQDQLQDKQDPFFVVSSGKVKAGDKELVDLDKIPFASLNKEYQRLKQESDELAKKLAEAKEKHRSNPDDEDIEELYFTLKRQYKDLTEEFNQYQNHLYNIALSFAKLDGERYSERIRRAKEEFEKGNVIAADEILNMEEMKREAEQEKQQYKQHEDNLRTKIEEFTMKAETVMGNTDFSVQERFAQACDAYDQAIEIAKLIHYEEDQLVEVLFGYAYLLQKFNRIYKAVDLYQTVLEIYRRLAAANPDAYESDVAMTLNNLAILQETLNRYDEAESNYQAALEIYRRLAAANPDAYEPNLAMTLNNLANLQKNLNRYDEAESNYIKALEIRRKLASVNPDAYESDVAMTLNNLAILQETLKRYDEAESNYQAALEIYRRLAAANPDAYEPNLAMTLNNLAILQYNLNRYDEAESNYQATLEIRRRLASVNPDAYESGVAMTLNNLANLQKNLKRYDEAESNYQATLEVYRRLASVNPDVYEPKVATILNNLAVLQSDVERYEEAESNYQAALEIRRKLASVNPDVYEPKVATILNNLAVLQSDVERYEEAESNYQAALEIYRRLAAANPDAYETKVADALIILSLVRVNLGLNEKAKENIIESLDIYERLEKRNPGLYTQDIEDLKDILAENEPA